LETETDLPKHQSRELAKAYAEKLTLRKSDFARKNEPGEKARTKLTQTFAKNLDANFTNLTLPKETQAMKNGLCKMKRLACLNFD
jgi:hypothetical protein